MKDVLYLQMMEMTKTALELNPVNKLVALLWHQGENDVVNDVTYEYYYENLTKLINSVRETFGEIPFIAGNFVLDDWMKDYPIGCVNVIKAQRDICAGIGKAAFVETDGLESNKINGNNDTVHFCREALNQLGIRYFNAYNSIK